MRSPVGPRRPYVSRALGGSLRRESTPERPGRADSLALVAHRRPTRPHGSLPAAGRELRGRSARDRGPRSTRVRAPRAAGTEGSWRPRAATIEGPAHVADRRGAGHLGDSRLPGSAGRGPPPPVVAVAAVAALVWPDPPGRSPRRPSPCPSTQISHQDPVRRDPQPCRNRPPGRAHPAKGPLAFLLVQIDANMLHGWPPPRCAHERVCSQWGTVCHHVELGVSRVIPSTLRRAAKWLA